MDAGAALVVGSFVALVAADHSGDLKGGLRRLRASTTAAVRPARTATGDTSTVFGKPYRKPAPARTRLKPVPDSEGLAPPVRLVGATEWLKTLGSEVRTGIGDLVNWRTPKWTGKPQGTNRGDTVADNRPIDPERYPGEHRRSTLPPPQQQGGGAAPPPQPQPRSVPRPATTGPRFGTADPSSFFEAADTIAGFPLEDIMAIQRLLKTIAEGNQRYEEAVRRLATRMGDHDVALDHMIIDPLVGFAAYLQAGTMKAAEADAALSALLRMSVGELAESSRRAPNARILNRGMS